MKKKRKKAAYCPEFVVAIRKIPKKKLKKLTKRKLKKRMKRKNLTSGAETKIKKKTFPLMARHQEEYSLSFVKKPFRKSTWKISSLSLKWNSCKATLQWKLQLKLLKA